MLYGFPCPSGYPIPYPAPCYPCGFGTWYAFFIVLLILILIFGGWWFFSKCY